jgi:endonuclease/exonuclease/phosphatase family metal-dependent hydrolase
MTYNIHYGIGRDRAYRLDRIIDLIKSENPDVVALQEVDKNLQRSEFDDQPKIIADILDMNFHYCVNWCIGDGKFGLATFSRFPISGNHHHDLSFCPRLKWRYRPRGTLRTDITVGAICLHVFNLHLGLGVRERIHQRRKLLSRSILLDRGLDHPVAILGDFNDRPISVVHSQLKDHFSDAFNLSGDKTNGATFCWGPLNLKLDHIYVSKQLLPVETYVVDTPLSRIASDHKPLVSKVELRV